MKRTQPAPGTEMTIPEAERYFLDKLPMLFQRGVVANGRNCKDAKQNACSI